MLAILLARPDRQWVLAALAAHERALLRYATTLVGAEDARDVVQETFLELCRAERHAVADHLVPWLFTVCKNRALTDRRRGKRRAAAEASVMTMGSETAHEDGPHGALEHKRTGETVLGLMAHLPEQSREVVALKFAGGLSYKQIADVTGLSVSHVGVLLHEALTKVRERMHKREHALVVASGRAS